MVLSDIEGKAAQGSGDRAWEAKEFQNRKRVHGEKIPCCYACRRICRIGEVTRKKGIAR